MGSFERGFCDPKEYTTYEPTRLRESHFAINGLYVVMLQLDGTDDGWASREVGRILTREPLGYDVCRVDLEFHDDDLKPCLRAKALFKDGYLQHKESDPVYIEEAGVLSGYLREEYGGEGGEKELQEWIAQAHDLSLDRAESSQRVLKY